METLADISPRLAPFVDESGVCDGDARILEWINASRDLLWDKGDWPNTTEYICIRCVNSCIYLPSAYEQIRLGWKCGNPATLGDEYFQSVSGADGKPAFDGRGIVNVGGYHVTFREYKKRPYYIWLQAENQQDEGKEVVFTAPNQYDTVVQIPMIIGDQWVKVQSLQRVKGIFRVVKPKTVGRIRVYAYNPDDGEYLLLAVYQPYDVNPNFQKLRISSCGTTTLTLLVKKKYFPLENPTDLVEFNFNVMCLACQAVTLRVAKTDDTAFINKQSLAIAELNKTIENQEIPTGGAIKMINPYRVTNLVENNIGWGGWWGGN